MATLLTYFNEDYINSISAQKLLKSYRTLIFHYCSDTPAVTYKKNIPNLKDQGPVV